MLSYSFYKWIHLLSLYTLFFSLGSGFIFYFLSKKLPIDQKIKKYLSILHGTSATFLFITGFGLLTRLGILSHFPLWVMIKWLCWLFLGIALFLFRLFPKKIILFTVLSLVIGMGATYLAIYHPFT